MIELSVFKIVFFHVRFFKIPRELSTLSSFDCLAFYDYFSYEFQWIEIHGIFFVGLSSLCVFC